MQHGKGSAWTKVKIYSFQRAQNFPIIQTPGRRLPTLLIFTFYATACPQTAFMVCFKNTPAY